MTLLSLFHLISFIDQILIEIIILILYTSYESYDMIEVSMPLEYNDMEAFIYWHLPL